MIIGYREPWLNGNEQRISLSWRYRRQLMNLAYHCGLRKWVPYMRSGLPLSKLAPARPPSRP